MRSQELKEALKLVNSPAIQVKASFDTDIMLQLKPEVFLKLCLINKLLVTETKPEYYYINKMNKKLQNAHLTSYMKKQNFLKQWVQGTGCLIKPDKLLFYEDKEFIEYEFALDGIEKMNCCKLEGQEI